MKTYRIGIIGFGNIGAQWTRAILEEGRGRWELAYICDTCPDRRAAARLAAPLATILESPDAIFSDSTIDVVGSFAIEDTRPDQLRKGLAAGKHMVIEKPIAPDDQTARELLSIIDA